MSVSGHKSNGLRPRGKQGRGGLKFKPPKQDRPFRRRHNRVDKPRRVHPKMNQRLISHRPVVATTPACQPAPGRPAGHYNHLHAIQEGPIGSPDPCLQVRLSGPPPGRTSAAHQRPLSCPLAGCVTCPPTPAATDGNQTKYAVVRLTRRDRPPIPPEVCYLRNDAGFALRQASNICRHTQQYVHNDNKISDPRPASRKFYV